MNPIFRWLPFGLFCLGLLVNGLLGTGTDLRFQWFGFGLIGAAIALAVMGSRGTLPEQRRWILPGISIAVLLLGYFLWRGLTSPVPYLAREDLALVAVWFAGYFAIALIFSRSQYRRWILGMWGAVLVINLGFVLWQTAVDPTAWILPGYERTYADRAGGVFNNPNHLAALFSATIPMLLALALFDRCRKSERAARWMRVAYLSLAILLGLALFLTKSRGGFVAAGCGLTVFAALAIWQARQFFPQKRRAITLASTVAMVALFSVAGLIGKPLLEQRFGERAAFSSGSEVNRPLIWKSALAQHAESPLIGTGARSFYFYSRKHRQQTMHNSVPEADFAHNEYLQILADYGWIGLGGVSLFVGMHLLQAQHFLRDRKSPRRSERLALTIGALSGVAALGAHAMFDFGLHTPVIGLLTATLLAVILVPSVRHRETPAPTKAPRLRPVLLSGVGAMAAFVAVCAVRYAPAEWHYEQARLAFERGDPSENATPHLARTIQADRHHPFAHSLLGHYALKDGDPAAADAAFSAAIDRYPQDIFARLGKAEALMQLERFDEAEVVLEIASQWAPLYGNLRQARGEVALAAERYDAARDHFQSAIEAPAFGDSHVARAALAETLAR